MISTNVITLTTKERFLRLDQVKDRVGLSRAAIYAAMAENRFPKNFPIHGTAKAWLESEIEAWMQARVDAARMQVA